MKFPDDENICHTGCRVDYQIPRHPRVNDVKKAIEDALCTAGNQACFCSINMDRIGKMSSAKLFYFCI